MLDRIRSACTLLCTIGFLGLAHAEVPDELLESPTAIAFGAPPTIASPMLSPDGSRLLFLAQDSLGVTMLRSIDFTDGSVTTLLQGSADGYDVLWCDFASETRLICDLRQGKPGGSVDYQKFYTLEADGSDLREMQRGTGCSQWNSLRNTPPIDRLPDDAERVMFFCGRSATQVNVLTRRVADISGAGEVGSRQRLFSNGHGLGNVYSAVTQDAERWHVRDTSESEWQEFHRTDRLTFEEPFRPVGYASNLDRVFNIAWNDDTGTWALFRQELTGDHGNSLVFAHDTLDVELVDTMGRFDRVVSVAFLEDRSRRAIVDRRVAEVYQFISDLLPALDMEILDESWDRNVYLARARAPGRTGEFILIDMELGSVQVIAPEYDHLTGYDLAPTRLIEIPGSDGGRIVAHLTLPHDADGPVPAVIIPRAEASHEDVADPHYLVQFLAASGYAVLRVQNRVDAEYGSGWVPLRAAVGWNRTADDLHDAAEYLVANGLTERDRICAIGKNYGAHAALMTAIKYPDLLGCVVSIAGMVDPLLMPGAEIMSRTVARMSDPALDLASPIKRAAEIEVPVLMFHGEDDDDVSMASHTVTLFNTLERSNKSVQFIEYPYGNHQIRRAPYRIDMLTRIGDFLAARIGAAPVADEETSAPE